MTTSAATMTVFPIRSVILDAAEKRFLYYGYNKTTMAEIAADAEMSAAIFIGTSRINRNWQSVVANEEWEKGYLL